MCRETSLSYGTSGKGISSQNFNNQHGPKDIFSVTFWNKFISVSSNNSFSSTVLKAF